MLHLFLILLAIGTVISICGFWAWAIDSMAALDMEKPSVVNKYEFNKHLATNRIKWLNDFKSKNGYFRYVLTDAAYGEHYEFRVSEKDVGDEVRKRYKNPG